MPGEENLVVEPENANLRLDLYIALKKPELSRSFIQKLIETQKVLVNNVPKKPHYKVKAADEIYLNVPESKEPELAPELMPLDILYEDGDILVINKPKGIAVHPGAGRSSGTLVNAILGHCGKLSNLGGSNRPGIVHRLDKDTSGVLVVAKTDIAYIQLAKQIQKHKADRSYIALVYGIVEADEGIIDAPIGRDTEEGKKFTVSLLGGREARTEFKVRERLGNFTLLDVKPYTGRTHQIRVHMSYINHPIVGDKTYGIRARKYVGTNCNLSQLIENLQGQALHAYSLGFVHPTKGEYMKFEAPMPENMERLIEYLRRKF